MSTCERGRKATAPSRSTGEATLDLIEDVALHLLVVLEGAFELAPAFFAPGLVAGQDGFTERIFDALQVNLDLVTNLDLVAAAGSGKFAQLNAAFGLQSDVDDGDVLFDADDGTLDHRAFMQIS